MGANGQGAGVAVSGEALGRKGRATRDRLLATAAATFAERAYDTVRIVDITADAGLASGSFYRYFESKEAIFAEVAAVALADLNAAAAVPSDRAFTDPVGTIEMSVRGFFAACTCRRELLRSIERVMATDDSFRSERRSALVRSGHVRQRFVEHLQAEGTADPTLDAWTTAVSLQAMTVSMAYDHLVWREPPDAEALDRLVVTVTRLWAKALGLDDRRYVA